MNAFFLGIPIDKQGTVVVYKGQPTRLHRGKYRQALSVYRCDLLYRLCKPVIDFLRAPFPAAPQKIDHVIARNGLCEGAVSSIALKHL